MILADMSARRRHDTLWLALGFVLQDLTGDSDTATVAAALRARLGFPASELPGVMTWLTRKAAPLVPEAAQTGAVVKAYGRYGRRWIWSPRRVAPGRSVAELVKLTPGTMERMLNESGALDTSDW